ncbi:MAG: prenyltransferase [Deltaproteobacteria bacterium]|nr:prenyltransferase [Deltaproteobacteria bacterium]
MNVRMWARAVYIIPHIEKAEWDGLDLVSRWLIATRAAVLIMTFFSAAIGGIIAWRDGNFSWLLWGVCTLGLCLAHATNNLLNDLIDHVCGIDTGNYFRTQYGPQPLEHGLMTRGGILAYAAATGLAALACGTYLVCVRGPATLVLIAIGAFFVVFYTWPLKYIGLGEFAVLAVWGPCMTGGMYYVLTGRWDWNVSVASLPFALGATSVLFGKHIDKLEADRARGVRTLPVLLGEVAARRTNVVLMALMYVAVIYLVAVRYFTPAVLAIVFALNIYRWSVIVYRRTRPAAPPRELPPGVWPLWYVAFAFQHNRRFGMLFLGGLLAELVIRRQWPGWWA